ncbi:transcriptional regulator [Planotetraspora silvatica]|uniref:Transcriptional regulator n=1 Tax=Planotetraspora silvatica TaxID=234614 RepID=A0A8J3UM07_9ACTN|nr:helix-turn-helix transcriptional regulator [Planotetraspora silvatica]GII45721.1 transcriptional regulator [Planotetraspora silvatica]
MEGRSALGDFLRARRQATTVDQVGLPSIGRRRTPGLRRDEVAMLADVSADYYVRLEQGRERNPSAQVLEALARVFQLDAEATEHLYDLARPRARRPHAPGAEQVCPKALRFILGCDHAVMLVMNIRLDILAKNPLATALYAGLDHCDNLIRLTFLNPLARDFYMDWPEQARDLAAHLRATVGTDVDDPSVRELVEELSRGSEDFRRLWNRHDIRSRTHRSIRYRHGEVGEMTLHFEVFHIGSAPGQQLVVGQAEPYGGSRNAFAKLASLAAEKTVRN